MRHALAERKMNQVISLPLADPGTPDLTSPTAYLRWVGKGQWRTLVVAICLRHRVARQPGALPRRDGQGHRRRHHRRRRRRAAAVVRASSSGSSLVSALSGAMRHKYAVANWMQGAFRSAQLIGHKAADTGEALTRTVPTGDVVATVSSDAMRIGGLYDVLARFAGAVVSYVVVALILLSASTPLGLVVLIGVPVLVACLTFIVPPAPGTPARPARGVRQAHRARRRHRRRAARAAWHRRRAHLPEAVCRPVAVRAPGRQPGRRLPGGARRGPGAAARPLRPRRRVARSAVRHRGRDHGGPARRVLRLHRLPRHPAADRDRDGRPRDASTHRRAQADHGAERRAGPGRGRPDATAPERTGTPPRPREPGDDRAGPVHRRRVGAPRGVGGPRRPARPLRRRPRRTSASTARGWPTPPSPTCAAGSWCRRPTHASSPARCATSSTRGASTTTWRSSRRCPSRAATTCSRRCPAASTTRSRSEAAPSRAASASGSR